MLTAHGPRRHQATAGRGRWCPAGLARCHAASLGSAPFIYFVVGFIYDAKSVEQRFSVRRTRELIVGGGFLRAGRRLRVERRLRANGRLRADGGVLGLAVQLAPASHYFNE